MMKHKVLWIFALFILSIILAGCNVRQADGPIAPLEPEQVLVPTATLTVLEDTAIVENTAVPQASPLPNTPTPTEPATEQENSMANADVLFVQATETSPGLWTFSVEVAHPDTGWEDYADGWDVLLPDGSVIKPNPDSPFTRLLVHPHVDEQPFTRSQSNIPIPAEVTTVTVRAHDLLDGFGGQEVVLDLTAVSGENFAVARLEQ
jgi:hypothetical protein